MTCPFIDICIKRVNFKYFKEVCTSSYECDYEECDMYKIYANDEFVPYQWKMITKRG